MPFSCIITLHIKTRAFKKICAAFLHEIKRQDDEMKASIFIAFTDLLVQKRISKPKHADFRSCESHKSNIKKSHFV